MSMPWVYAGDGLRLVGAPHFNVAVVRTDIDILRRSKRNRPGRMCDKLLELLETGHIDYKWLHKLSKWCHWNFWSEEVAQRIAQALFGVVPIRLWDEDDKPIPDRGIENDRYEAWRQQVVAGRRQSRVPLNLLQRSSGVAFATDETAYWLCPCSEPHLHAALVGISGLLVGVTDEYRVVCPRCHARYFVVPDGADHHGVSQVDQF